jgi:LAO/AO transport system kinase
LPTEFSARIARNTQLIIQEETGITNTIDPWGGSYLMESLTQQIADRAWELIAEVEEQGGMARAIETGMPKMRIEESAARKQARIDRGEDVIVGVNKYRLATEDAVDILEIDNRAVREAQLERLAAVRARRDAKAVQAALDALTQAAKTGEGNVLELAVNATRLRATVGEISSALEKEWGRYSASANTISGVYGSAYEKDEDWAALRADIEDFVERHGRRPRMLVCKMGQDGHDRGAKVVATAFADVGFDIDLSPMFSTPDEVARQADRERRARGGRLVAGRGPQDPGARADRGAARAGRGRHRGDCRRRDPAPGLRVPVRGRGQVRLRARHAHPAGGAPGARRDRGGGRLRHVPVIDTAALRAGNRRALAKAITLVESSRAEHRAEAQRLLEALLPHTGRSIRVGISGIPGVGKSTFIEAFGMHLVAAGHRVAVLAVDPSSPVAGGSILGDKTRMETLSREDGAFIRPSPSQGALGGVAHKTRETMLLCEAAGYDVIIVETVGVGQSEYEVASMVDFFLVLMLPNAGDELQGIKRGIMELADALVINKADGESLGLANRTRQHYQNAMNLLSHGGFWVPRVTTCSAAEKRGIAEVWQMIGEYRQGGEASGELAARRARQNGEWLRKLISELLEQRFRADPRVRAELPRLEARVVRGEITPYSAAMRLLG